MSRNRWRSTGRVAGLSVGRLLVMLTALAGLVAMHGLSEHGVMHHDMSGSTSTVSGAMDVVAALALDGSAVVTTDPIRRHVSGSPDQDDAMTMVMCVALLGGLALLLLGGRGRSTGLAPRSVSSHIDVGNAGRSRVPDPPDLFALSIQRC